MTQLHCMKYTVACAIAGLLAASMGRADSSATTQPRPQQSQWEKDIAENYDAFRLLFQNEPTGNNGSEVFQWQAKALKDNPERIKDLQKIVKDYPDCPFADDAALLLARAQFLYKGDSKAAIDGLYAVVKKYPSGTWFAGDLFVLSTLAPLGESLKPYRDEAGTLRLKVIDDVKASEKKTGEARSELSQVIEYLNYQQAHPNKTAEEAKYWIAWIIMQAQLKERYPEAKQLLCELEQQYSGSNRTQEDVRATKELKNALLAKLPRVERNASAALVELLERTGKKAEALVEAQRCAERYKDSPLAEWANKKAEQLKREQ